MTADDQLAAMLRAIQTDPAGRGLATHPTDNLFTARPGDFAAACRSIAGHPSPRVEVVTGFYIPTADPPGFETDGPLGALFLKHALELAGIPVNIRAEPPVLQALGREADPDFDATHRIAVERSGPAADDEHYTMRQRPISPYLDADLTRIFTDPGQVTTVGIGDGGNEIGMGRIPAATVIANIPGGASVHCRVTTDFLIVCGVSNWGAYALAAGVCVLRGVIPPADLFDPDRHRADLSELVERGPLVDGVTGRAEATVDGLSWDDYVRPLVEIGRIVRG